MKKRISYLLLSLALIAFGSFVIYFIITAFLPDSAMYVIIPVLFYIPVLLFAGVGPIGIGIYTIINGVFGKDDEL